MSSENRKTDDQTIIDLNSVGLSLARIAQQLDCHPTTITHRLRAMDVPPSDTRRAFMEEIYEGLTPAQRIWLVDQLYSGRTIKDFLRSLIIKEYTNRKK